MTASATRAPLETTPDTALPFIDHWIDGALDSGDSDRAAIVYNPAAGTPAARVRFASVADVDRAVEAAARAFATWSRTPLGKRAAVLFKFRELVVAHSEELARCIVREHGKVLADARGEVQRGLEVVEFACGIPHLIKGEFSENVSSNVDSYSIRQPLGVVAGITPFNFPVMVPMWMFPIAIASGNAFVLKPSEKDPSASNMIAELWRDAGLPPGVFTVVHGDKVAVDRILEHPGIAAVSFVGSTPVARRIYETATRNGKRVQALGGAKNHMVVLPDADMDLAADSAVNAAFGSAGERCMAISVAVAVGDAAGRLVPMLAERVAAIHVGDGLDPRNDMGPLVTGEHLARVRQYVNEGVSDGATLVADGRASGNGGPGFFLGPCVFDNVRPEMSIYRDEIFGPVLSIVRAATYEEALSLVNANPYANGVAIFTNDGGAARRFQSEVQVGMVGINVPIPVPMAYYSFGGWKSSLFGDAHVHGAEGVKFYTRGKVITARWPDPGLRGKNLGFPTTS
ncbi:MAG TPA: CoA-acylating methylmalonate-semialdehyde dehydrogenase [Gemmatimonadaceae bacterium]|jgi:malonate-semialdehyde dehydrogenase (acetylating) / methylmalonate-semialdehyde dehydrogenase|nr:CoA-acylating methylmalonate-semialdehyde dehydrogenase [Gemmatimonadaceae bacterium]